MTSKEEALINETIRLNFIKPRFYKLKLKNERERKNSSEKKDEDKSKAKVDVVRPSG